MSKEPTIYDYMRNWFDFCFENPEMINTNHSALYFFILSHSNRLGWKPKFGLPTTMVKEAIGIKSYTTYIKTLNDIVSFGFIKMIEKSKNQYSSNIIALTENVKAPVKALDKATVKHVLKQVKSTCESNNTIDILSTNLPINKNTIEERKLKFANSCKVYVSTYGEKMVNDFIEYWTEPNKSKTKFKQETEKTWDTSRRLKKWSENEFKFNSNKHKQTTLLPHQHNVV